MPRRVENIKMEIIDAKFLSFTESDRNTINAGLVTHRCRTISAIPEASERSDMIGMNMRINRKDQFDIELIEQLDILIRILDHRIDLAAGGSI